MSDYVPIACAEHEKLEFAVLRRQWLRLEWREGAAALRAQRVLPTDVATRGGAEWLSYREEDGTCGEIRLDRIISAQTL